MHQSMHAGRHALSVSLQSSVESCEQVLWDIPPPSLRFERRHVSHVVESYQVSHSAYGRVGCLRHGWALGYL